MITGIPRVASSVDLPVTPIDASKSESFKQSLGEAADKSDRLTGTPSGTGTAKPTKEDVLNSEKPLKSEPKKKDKDDKKESTEKHSSGLLYVAIPVTDPQVADKPLVPTSSGQDENAISKLNLAQQTLQTEPGNAQQAAPENELPTMDSLIEEVAGGNPASRGQKPTSTGADDKHLPEVKAAKPESTTTAKIPSFDQVVPENFDKDAGPDVASTKPGLAVHQEASKVHAHAVEDTAVKSAPVTPAVQKQADQPSKMANADPVLPGSKDFQVIQQGSNSSSGSSTSGDSKHFGQSLSSSGKESAAKDIDKPHTVADFRETIVAGAKQTPVTTLPDHAKLSNGQSDLQDPQMAQPTHRSVSAAPVVNTAQMVQKLNSSEMRVGLHSPEFGAIAIHTALEHGRLSANISVEHSSLSNAVAEQLPALQSKLINEQGIQTQINLHDHSTAFSGGTGQQGSTERRESTSSSSMKSVLQEAREARSASVSTVSAVVSDGRLSIRI